MDRPPVEQLKGKHILLVDDHPGMSDLLTKLLARYQVRVSDANCGNKALNEIEHEPPDLILLDLNLPDMNGLEIVTRVRQNENTKSLPILVVSASSSEEQNCLGMGCGFLLKPFHPSDLVTLIARIVN
jgi:DNA-binding response OmpR family regulator